jgi:hypothetical protein
MVGGLGLSWFQHRKGQDVLEEVAQCEGELREVLQDTLLYRSITDV